MDPVGNILGKPYICNKCGKRIVHPDDWGDYDDACEWACRCPQKW